MSKIIASLASVPVTLPDAVFQLEFHKGLHVVIHAHVSLIVSTLAQAAIERYGDADTEIQRQRLGSHLTEVPNSSRPPRAR